MAGFADLRLKHEFSGTKEDVGGYQLSPRIRQVENLATHTAMTIVEDDESLLKGSPAWVTASLAYLLVRHCYLMLQSHIADAYSRARAPHDGTMAGFADLGLKHEFSGTKKDVGRHQLSPRIRQVENLATHTAMTIVEDDESLLKSSPARVAASLAHLLVRYCYLMSQSHRFRPFPRILRIKKAER